MFISVEFITPPTHTHTLYTHTVHTYYLSAQWLHSQIFSLQLKKELDAFDPSFFEEIEDLKFNYQEAMKRNVQLEEQMRKLSQHHGFSLEHAENT